MRRCEQLLGNFGVTRLSRAPGIIAFIVSISLSLSLRIRPPFGPLSAVQRCVGAVVGYIWRVWSGDSCRARRANIALSELTTQRSVWIWRGIQLQIDPRSPRNSFAQGKHKKDPGCGDPIGCGNLIGSGDLMGSGDMDCGDPMGYGDPTAWDVALALRRPPWVAASAWVAAIAWAPAAFPKQTPLKLEEAR